MEMWDKRPPMSEAASGSSAAARIATPKSLRCKPISSTMATNSATRRASGTEAPSKLTVLEPHEPPIPMICAPIQFVAAVSTIIDNPIVIILAAITAFLL